MLFKQSNYLTFPFKIGKKVGFYPPLPNEIPGTIVGHREGWARRTIIGIKWDDDFSGVHYYNQKNLYVIPTI